MQWKPAKTWLVNTTTSGNQSFRYQCLGTLYIEIEITSRIKVNTSFQFHICNSCALWQQLCMTHSWKKILIYLTLILCAAYFLCSLKQTVLIWPFKPALLWLAVPCKQKFLTASGWVFSAHIQNFDSKMTILIFILSLTSQIQYK